MERDNPVPSSLDASVCSEDGKLMTIGADISIAREYEAMEPCREETDEERIARGDLRWSDAKPGPSSFTAARNRFAKVPLDRILSMYTLTQKNLNRIVLIFIFCWISEWLTFASYVTFIYGTAHWTNAYQVESNVAHVMWKIQVGLMLSFQLLFYIGRVLSAVVFFVFGMITLYICITNRKLYRFSSPK